MEGAIILFLEILGIVAFAVSGAVTAIEKGLDVFGVVFIGVITALGGGVIRDIILGIFPPIMFTYKIYAVTSIIASLIVFLTAYPQYAIEGYSAKAYQYILKDEWEKKLDMTLKNIQKEIQSRMEPSYRITVSTKLEKVPVKDIYYLYKSGKNVVFQTRNGESTIRKTLSEVYEELPEKEFIYVDRSFIVNIEHVMKLKNKEIYMSNGEIISVSKPQLERVKKQINAYWRSHV